MAHLPRIILDAVLFCPHCGGRHIDESRNGEKWHRRAHTTHRCQHCGQDFDVYVSGAEPAAPVEMKVGGWTLESNWKLEDVDKITAALALPATAPGSDVALAVRSLTRRCEELEHQVLALQDSHKMEPKH